MKRFLFSTVSILLCVLPAFAQNKARSPYSFDNLDTNHGVRVAGAPTPSTSPSSKTNTRRTSSARTASRTKKVAYVLPSATNIPPINRALGGFTTGNTQVDRYIIEAGHRNGVDPALLYSIMHQESSFKPRAVSNKGASGLMQLMPGTAARFGVRDRFDPRQNIEGGARYMRFLLDFFKGNIPLALAGYNAGEGAVLRYNRNIPPYRETQEYVRRITRRYSLLRDPEAARAAQPVTPTEVAAIQAQPPIPTTLYERNVYSVRLPDGRLRLVSE